MVREKDDPSRASDSSGGRPTPSGGVKYFPKQFQKLVIQTLLEKGKSEDSGDSDDDFELPEFIDTNLELTKKRLKEFPTELLGRCEFVQYLYLDRNKLSELPGTFFQSLRKLKWLDLRNNLLVALPNAGLDDHSHLQFLLLQGNRIKNLPTELGSTPKLKGLQITGNPIVNVPYEVIAQGFHSIIKHLQRLKAQENILLPNSDAIVLKPSTVKEEDKSAAVNGGCTREAAIGAGRMGLPKEEDPYGAGLRRALPEESEDHEWEDVHPDFQVMWNACNETQKLFLKSKICRRPRQKAITSGHHSVTKKCSRLGYKRKMITPEMLQEKAKKESQAAKRKEILEKQARKIQRMKDKEVLKSWRRQTFRNSDQIKLLDNYQQYPSRNFAASTPFDVDPEFFNMLNRADLYWSLKELEAMQKRKRKTIPRLHFTICELERQMRDITKKLEGLCASSADGISPRTKQGHLCNKIAQMKDIQKALQNLQIRNSTMTAVSAPGPN